MVKIRLRRVGAKKQASYRVVAADSRAPRDGRFIEEIGFYNPRTDPETVRIKEERALYWLSVGAQPSDAVARLLRSSGTLERFERLRQGESLEDLVAEAEAEKIEEAEKAEPEHVEAPEAEEAVVEPEVEEAEEAEPAEPTAEMVTDEVEEEAPEEPEPVETVVEAETEEAEEDDQEPEANEAGEQDEPEE